MKIAMFTDSYKPQVNGVVTSIEMAKKSLEKKGHDVMVFAPSVPKYTDTEGGIHRFKSVSFMAHKEYRISAPVDFLAENRGFEFDVIHVHTPFSIGALALGLTRKYYVPCVGTFHTLFSEYIHYFIRPQFIGEIKEVKMLFDKFSWRYLPWFYNQMDSIISPSESIKNLLEKKGIRKKISVVPTGIKDSMISRKTKKDCRKKFNFGSGKIVLHVGRISKEKNLAFLITSLKDILLKSDSRLVITSEGPEKPSLERLVRNLGIEKSVVFAGYMAESDIADMYRAADIFVMASKSETQGVVLLEAAANGLPCVVLDAPVTSDFVRKNRIGIVSKEDEFAAGVEKMLNEGGAYAKNAAAHGRRYAPDKFANSLLRIYKQTKKHQES
ncbi:MAG: glycosyltransferase [Candidatus Aenigmarchaeota archaeon]|nr:glycosyltransferase [Candidatus Aenigmarchaeota archaeon]